MRSTPRLGHSNSRCSPRFKLVPYRHAAVLSRQTAVGIQWRLNCWSPCGLRALSGSVGAPKELYVLQLITVLLSRLAISRAELGTCRWVSGYSSCCVLYCVILTQPLTVTGQQCSSPRRQATPRERMLSCICAYLQFERGVRWPCVVILIFHLQISIFVDSRWLLESN